MIVIEVAKSDGHQLVVIFLTCFCGRKFHTNVVFGESMHGFASWCLFKQNFGCSANKLAIEILGLLIGEFQQSSTTLTLILIADHIGNGECRCSRTL